MALPVTVGPVRVNGVPSLDSCTSTINEKISEATIAEFNSNVHIRVKSEPRIRRELELRPILVSVMEDGVGTLYKIIKL